MFARVIAIAPPRWAQSFKVVPHGTTSAKTAEHIAKLVDGAIADKNVRGLALIMPTVTTLEETAEVMLALAQLPKWTTTPSVLENERVGRLVALRVARLIPFGQGECESEALVLGPFDDFPETRRAPVTAMEIYVGEPEPNDPKTGTPTVKANLAHMIARDKYPGDFDMVWQKSMDGRESSLGTKNDNRAKAKVTMVLPTAMARKLGCVQ